MNMQIQNNLEQLVDLNCPKITEKRKAILLSLFNRILNHDFGEEILNENQLQMSIVKNSQTDKTRTLNLLTHLQSKHSLMRRNHVLYCLLKISEDNKQMQQSSMYQSGFSTRYSKMSVRTLPNISTQFNQSSMGFRKQKMTTSLMSPYQSVLKDLVSCFQGLNCQYFEYDVSLQMFILKVKYEKLFSIPLRKFLIELNEIGYLFMKIQDIFAKEKQKQDQLVFQCVIGAVKEEMNEFFEFLASLDNYQKCNEFLTPNFFYPIYFYAKPQFQKILDLAQVFQVSYDMTSSQILSYFYLVSKNHFIEEKRFLRQIFLKIMRPFLEFLNNWITQGEVLDPFNEFFVKINTKCSNLDYYWTDGLIFYKSKVPYFMEGKNAEKIFYIGKLVRLLKKINISFIINNIQKIEQDELLQNNENAKLQNRLDNIYQQKTEILNSYIFKEQNLIKIFKDVQGAYLTTRGDFINEFLLFLDKEIGLQNIHKVMKHQIFYCLDNAVRKVVLKSSAFYDNIQIQFYDSVQVNYEQENFHQYFIHFTFTMLKYDIPINYFFYEQNVLKYQECLKYLLTFKIQNFQLSQIWQIQCNHKYSKNIVLRKLIAKSSKLRSKLSSFINGLLNYWLVDVIGIKQKDFFLNLNNDKDFNQILKLHDNFLQGIYTEICHGQKNQEELNPKIKQNYDYYLHSILELIMQFKSLQKRIFITIKENIDLVEDDSYDQIDHMDNEKLQKIQELSLNFAENTSDNLKICDHKFTDLVIQFLDFMNVKLLTEKIDYNEYYHSEKSKKHFDNQEMVFANKIVRIENSNLNKFLSKDQSQKNLKRLLDRAKLFYQNDNTMNNSLKKTKEKYKKSAPVQIQFQNKKLINKSQIENYAILKQNSSKKKKNIQKNKLININNKQRLKDSLKIEIQFQLNQFIQ